MNAIYELFQQADRDTIRRFLGNKSVFDVLMSYEAAFGSVQLLAYERDTMEAVIDKYISSDEASKMLFCERLEKGVSSKNLKAKKKAERQIRKFEFLLKVKCFLARLFRRHNIAESLRKQYNDPGIN